ncbi:hypothetical protein BDW74DRAFT_175244 [Aspergillus multicolor]|uniref:uncharacterized protein n=1 Tax=Aspergillus multicolor TaxID=41759 RepID=UPI003CCD6D3F
MHSQFLEDERVTRKLTCDVADHFHQANLPYVLFGWQAIPLAGSRAITNEVGFVIPDAHMAAAINVLVAAGYDHCQDATCNELKVDRVGPNNSDINMVISKNRYHSVPAAHFRFQPDNVYALSLHLQSEVLWWLPDIQAGPPAANDAAFMLSNDPRLPPCLDEGGSGPWLGVDDTPVKIMKINSLTEAVMWLWCQDSALRILQVCWMAVLKELEDEPEGRHTKVTKKLRPDFQYAWDCFSSAIRLTRLDGTGTLSCATSLQRMDSSVLGLIP